MIEITKDDFSVEEIIRRAKRPDVGAIVTFLGTVRDDDILKMELEAYKEAALPELERIRDEAFSKFDLRSVDIIHRVGSLNVGDNIALIVVSAGHRKEAFEGCAYVLEELKRRTPIWKKEFLKEGERWVGQ